MVKRAVLGAVVVGLLFSLAGCDFFGLFGPDYEGTWKGSDGTKWIQMEFTETSYTRKFSENENMVPLMGGSQKGDLAVSDNEMTFTIKENWETDSEKWASSDNISYKMTYSVSGDTITLDSDNLTEPWSLKEQ